MENLKNDEEFEINNLISNETTNATNTNSNMVKSNRFSKYIEGIFHTKHRHTEVELKEFNKRNISKEGGEEEERIQWDSFTEYFLSIIGFVIDLGNVWRFPTVWYILFNLTLTK